MATLKERVLALVRAEPGKTDRELTDRLRGREAPQQGVNQAARQLRTEGLILRRARADGLTGNYPVRSGDDSTPLTKDPIREQPKDFIAEDDVKRSVQRWLESEGWTVTVVLGRAHGIDIVARREKHRWVIEAKGQGKIPPMRVNFFLGVLGELLQRMDDPEARYSIAVPDLPQYRALWRRLPALAKKRAQISALFVTGSGQVEEVA